MENCVDNQNYECFKTIQTFIIKNKAEVNHVVVVVVVVVVVALVVVVVVVVVVVKFIRHYYNYTIIMKVQNYSKCQGAPNEP